LQFVSLFSDKMSLQVINQIKATDDEWGLTDIAISKDVLASASFDGIVKIWHLPNCNLIKSIQLNHAINCISVNAGELQLAPELAQEVKVQMSF